LPADFEVCWAGPNFFEPTGLCFGSTRGELLRVTENGQLLGHGKGSVSGGAINGIARIGDWVGVSTPEEVNFWPLDGQPGAALLHGAHDITSTKSGFFIAPAGQSGIMVVPPGLGPNTAGKAYAPQEDDLYVYRLTVLDPLDGVELIACANRSGGISVAEFIRRAVRDKLPPAAEPPWMRYAGMVESGNPRSSRSIDDEVCRS